MAEQLTGSGASLLPAQRLDRGQMRAVLDERRRDPDIGPAILGEIIGQLADAHRRHIEACRHVHPLPSVVVTALLEELDELDELTRRYPRTTRFEAELTAYAVRKLVRQTAGEETRKDPALAEWRSGMLDELDELLLGAAPKPEVPRRNRRRGRQAGQRHALARWKAMAEELQTRTEPVTCLVFQPEGPVRSWLDVHHIAVRSGLRATVAAAGFGVYPGAVAEWLESQRLLDSDSPRVFRLPDAPTELEPDQWHTGLVLCREATFQSGPRSPLSDPAAALRAAAVL